MQNLKSRKFLIYAFLFFTQLSNGVFADPPQGNITIINNCAPVFDPNGPTKFSIKELFYSVDCSAFTTESLNKGASKVVSVIIDVPMGHKCEYQVIPEGLGSEDAPVKFMPGSTATCANVPGFPVCLCK